MSDHSTPHREAEPVTQAFVCQTHFPGTGTRDNLPKPQSRRDAPSFQAVGVFICPGMAESPFLGGTGRFPRAFAQDLTFTLKLSLAGGSRELSVGVMTVYF